MTDNEIRAFKLIFAWYDFWIGVYWDREKQHLYIFPVPTIGVRIAFSFTCSKCHKRIQWSKMARYCGRTYCLDCWYSKQTFDEEI